MRQLSDKILSLFGYIGSIIVFILGIFIILLFFPNRSSFFYEYSINQPWVHENLIAEMDFPIIKTNVEIEKEKDSIYKSLNYIFYIDSNIISHQLNLFNNYFNETWDKVFENFPEIRFDSLLYVSSREHLQSEIFKIYNNGLIQINSDLTEESIIALEQGYSQTYQKYSSYLKPQEAIALINKSATVFLSSAGLNISNLNSLLKSINFGEVLKPNIIYDNIKTERILNEQLLRISNYKGLIQKGQILIRKGDIVDIDKNTILESYKEEYGYSKSNKSNTYLIVIGQAVLVLGCFLMLFLYLIHFKEDILQRFSKTFFIVSLILLLFIATALIQKYELISIYSIPYVLIGVIIRSFYKTKLALFSYLTSVLIISLIVSNSFEFVYLQSLAGVSGIFSLVNVRRRGHIFITSLVVFVTYSILYLAIESVNGKTYETYDFSRFMWFGLNSLMLLGAYPLIYIYEKSFGLLSDVRLLELTDTNNKVLRLLAEKAPGTFQHSLQVANLSEEVILRIGGNSLLVRAGALYHDLGKLALPAYFIENQVQGHNPHNDIDNLKSVDIIRGHVTYGIEMAKKHGLPDGIIDFIKTHHGNSRIEYFYKTYKTQNPDKIIDESKFSYKGKIPFSKETAVVMMADCVEAASRSLMVYSEASINDLVNKIIHNLIENEQLNDADITFKDISIAKEVFKKKLKNIYHTRVEYPK